MKKQLIAIATLAVLSSPAFATKARMLALGENIGDNQGSFYFSDSRNIFQNAAYANEYKDMVIMEWGGSALGTANSKGDSDKTPQAEGGFLKSHGNMVYGIYVGQESPYTNEIRSYSRLTNADAFHQDNQIDLFVAGEAAFKWGVNATVSKSENDSADAKQESASLRFGAIANKIEGFVNVALKNEAEIGSLTGANPNAATSNGGKDEFEGKLGFDAGATYDANFAKVFAYVRHAKWEHTGDSVNVGTTGNYTAYTGEFDGTYWLYQVGAGKENKLNDKATLFTKLEYLSFARKVEATSGAADGAEINLDDYRVPVTVGLEYDALSWLTVRGSVVQNVISQTDNDYDGETANIAPAVLNKRKSGKRTAANSTNVNAGLTLKFGELSIDGVIGTNGTSKDTTTEDGSLTLDNLASRVAMTYKF